MLTKLTLQNFRGFEHHELPLREMTIVVGRNNAGKSTVVEALRLISIIVSRYRRLTFYPGPDWCGAGRVNYGVRPSLRNTEINFDGLFYHYGDPPGIVTAQFASGESVTVYIADEERIHAVIRDRKRRIIKNREDVRNTQLPSVGIMPQVMPLQKREVVLNEDYVRSAVFSPLAPSHFRNQILVFDDSVFELFIEIVEQTWPGVQIVELTGKNFNPGSQLHLEVRNEDFVGELALMGHGLQMWLQTMWFLALSVRTQTIILDEPDVYMHPDLQRRLIRFLRGRYPQCVITTHSIEILSEVNPEDVLVVDRRNRQSRFADSLPAVQRLVDNVGSIHNLSLARLWRARRLLLVEGDDIPFLKAFQNVLFPE
jgi:energy-coupling factor transporter ATP-binding protein EcfA2